MFIINWYQSKKLEFKVKKAVYSEIISFLSEKKDTMKLLRTLYDSVKDVPQEELMDKFIGALAQAVHEESISETQHNKNPEHAPK